MAFWDNYPYTNFHELNLDWVLKEIKRFFAVSDDADKKATAAVATANRAETLAEQATAIAVPANSITEDKLSAAVRNKINGAVSDIANAEADISELQTGIANVVKPDVLILGNSWGAGGQQPEGMAYGWGNYFSKFYKKGNVYNGSRDGWGINRFVEEFETLVAAGRHTNAGTVIMSGSINNRADPSSVRQAFIDTVGVIRRTIPKARIVMVCPDCSVDSTINQANKQVNLYLASAARATGVPILFLQDAILAQPSHFVGNRHVDEDMANQIAGWIAQYLDGGTLDWNLGNDSASRYSWTGSSGLYQSYGSTFTRVTIAGFTTQFALDHEYIRMRASQIVPCVVSVSTPNGSAYIPAVLEDNRCRVDTTLTGTITGIRAYIPPLTNALP